MRTMETAKKCPQCGTISVGDSIGFLREDGRRFQYIPITNVTDKGLELTETHRPYEPNVFVLPWDKFERYIKEGKYKVKGVNDD